MSSDQGWLPYFNLYDFLFGEGEQQRAVEQEIRRMVVANPPLSFSQVGVSEAQGEYQWLTRMLIDHISAQDQQGLQQQQQRRLEETEMQMADVDGGSSNTTPNNNPSSSNSVQVPITPNLPKMQNGIQPLLPMPLRSNDVNNNFNVVPKVEHITGGIDVNMDIKPNIRALAIPLRDPRQYQRAKKKNANVGNSLLKGTATASAVNNNGGGGALALTTGAIEVTTTGAQAQRPSTACKICDDRDNVSMKSREELKAHLFVVHQVRVRGGGGDGGVCTSACPSCHRGFANKVEYLSHMSTESMSCAFCPEKFHCIGNWNRHVSDVHLKGVQPSRSDGSQFPCTLCKNLMRTKHSLLNHYLTHVKDLCFICPLCSKSTTTKRRNKPTGSTLCASFRTLKGMSRHISFQHTEEEIKNFKTRN